MKLKVPWYVLLPVLLLIILRIPSLFESYWYGDEAIYASVARGLVSGKALYAQVWDHKPPLIFLLFYPAAVIGWDLGFVLLRFVNILLGVSSVIFLSGILKKSINDKIKLVSLLVFSALLGSTILEGDILNAEVIFMAFNLAALFLLLHKKYFYLVGVMGFLSLFTKVPGFVEFSFISLVFAITYLKEKGFSYVLKMTLQIIIGFAVPTFLMFTYFYLRGTFSDFLYANFIFNRIYSLHQGSYVTLLGHTLPTIYLSALSLFLVFSLTTILYLKKIWSNFAYLAIVLFVAEFFASLLSDKNYSHYFLQVLPAISLIIALLLESLIKGVTRKKTVFAGLTVATFIPMWIVFQNGGELPIYARPEEYYRYFLTDRDKFWWGKGDEIREYAEYIDTHYTEYNPVYIYTSKPWIEALVKRETANKYVAWFHLQYREEHLNEEISKNMSRANLFVLDHDPQLLDPVKELLERDFKKVDSFKNFDIYIRQ